MFAVVKIGSTQYMVSPGQELLVDYQGKDVTTMSIKDVLLISDGESVQIGKPVLGVTVEADVTGVVKGEKVRSAKYKAKSRYRKVRGFRAMHTRIKITKIGDSVSEITDKKNEKVEKVVVKSKKQVNPEVKVKKTSSKTKVEKSS